MSGFFTLSRSAAVTCSLTLSACASGYSGYLSDLQHWDSISRGDLSDRYGEWARCVESSIAKGGSFAAVLDRCEATKGRVWSMLNYDDEKRLINAAWGAYKDAEYEMNVRDAEAITN
jgi:hypothetical protein